MSAQYYAQWMALSPGSLSHVIAVSDPPQSWSFFLVYEGDQTEATINIGGQITDLEVGLEPQTIEGTGDTVILSWILGQADSIKIASNPFNVPDISDGYPLEDIQTAPGEFHFQLAASPGTANWDLEISVDFTEGSTAQQLSLLVDGVSVVDLPSGSSTQRYPGMTIGIAVVGLTGDLKIGYTLQ